ncbi:MAG: hypothetical protein EZS28_012890 [Streblomastix strix]|uniref:Uncharacterized protein n=1 Tax=Streblomastix strix TaxID=222440 RepID=A0A5J4W9I9_9EUKA|nr:MAG: hypothetical protein EZS28_012890 [Streblomastix strix]
MRCQQMRKRGRHFSASQQTSYSSYAVIYSARNRYPARRALNYSIFDRPRDTITERRSLEVQTGDAINERTSSSWRGR